MYQVYRFCCHLLPGEHHLVGVDDHHEIARIDVRRIRRAMLAHQDHGNIRSEPADDLFVGVNQPPLLFELARLGDISLCHRKAGGPSQGGCIQGKLPR